MEAFANSKGVGLFQVSTDPPKWNILNQDVSLPAACLSRENLENNIKWMQEFIGHYPQTKLAPHGKTTMCPQLFHKQIQAGAWGMTLATAQQCKVAAEFGVRNILLANQLVGKNNMEMISAILNNGPTEQLQFICIVDSVQNLQQLGSFFRVKKQKLQILIEIGILENGRTGLRSEIELRNLVEELQANWMNTISLVGFEFYEGVLTTVNSVVDFIRSQFLPILNVAFSICRFGNDEIILSGAGSIYFDVVATELAKIELPTKLALKNHSLIRLIRPGCYLTQDVGHYQEAHDRMQKTNPVVSKMGSKLVPALKIWANVQSKPTPELIVLGLGRRDVAFDAGLPKPSLHFKPASSSSADGPIDITAKNWTITKLMDQHAFMNVNDELDFAGIDVGDMIGFDIFHPCTTFDKWRSILLIDNEYNVVDILQTYF